MQTEAGIALLESFIGQPLAVMIDQWAETLPFCLARYDEALALAALDLVPEFTLQPFHSPKSG